MDTRHALRSTVILLAALAVCVVAGLRFAAQWRPEPLHPSPFLTEARKLSDYHAPLRGTAGDTDVFVFDSGVPGGTLLVCGGSHPNEPAAFIAAVTILENLRVTEGRVIVIPRTNASGFTHTDPQEAMPLTYTVDTPHGGRTFRHGSRLTNPARQWPDPSIYINPRGTHWEETLAAYPDAAAANAGPGGQYLAGVDSRNVNRNYPGNPDGTLTEQMAYAIVELIRNEGVKLAIDFHEASPEYPTINVMVAHERAASLTSWAELLLSDDGIRISTDVSSPRLRGLSHREWGDASTQTLSLLFETANVVMGRLKGRTSEAQIVDGRDDTYHRVSLIQQELNERLRRLAEEQREQGTTVTERSRKILNVEYPKEGIPLKERVGRHVMATRRVVEAYNEEHADAPIKLERLPSYAELMEQGLAPWLHGPNGEPPTAHTPGAAAAGDKPTTASASATGNSTDGADNATSATLADLTARDSLRLVVTDSGLGGLSVAADIARRAAETGVYASVDITFVNALFRPEAGYNSLPDRRRKVRIFDNALAAMKERHNPDAILVACNTLSVLLPDCAAATDTTIPVTGIVETGVDMVARALARHTTATALLFATQTTVEEETHRLGLLARGVPQERFVVQACPELTWYIEQDPAGFDTSLMISGFISEALEKRAAKEGPVAISLNCTHFGYSRAAWESELKEQGVELAAMLNPNDRMADALFPRSLAGRHGDVAVRVTTESMVEITTATVDALAPVLEKTSPETAASLRAWKHVPGLFEWESVVATGVDAR